jgi:hypothetical protein
MVVRKSPRLLALIALIRAVRGSKIGVVRNRKDEINDKPYILFTPKRIPVSKNSAAR